MKFMRRGDKAVVYVTEKTGFAATLEISGEGRFDPERARLVGWDHYYPYVVDITLEQEGWIPVSSTVAPGADGIAAPIKTKNTILDEIEFITDSGAGPKGNARWNLFLYPSLMRIPESDYKTIQSRL